MDLNFHYHDEKISIHNTKRAGIKTLSPQKGGPLWNDYHSGAEVYHQNWHRLLPSDVRNEIASGEPGGWREDI